MNEIAREQFMATMFRFRRYGASLPADCEFQYAELSVMQRVAGRCPLTDKGLDVNEIQKSLSISKSAVSQILSSLERRGYIVRQIDKSDRRKIEVTATPSGEDVLHKAIASYHKMLDMLLSRYGEENMQQLVERLDKLFLVYDEVEQEMGKG